MRRLIRRLFKRRQPVIVYRNGRRYKFRSFSRAVAFALHG